MEALISAGATALLDAVADGITIQDVNGRLLYANPAAARHVGVKSAAELIAMDPAEIVKRFDLFDEFGQPLSRDALPGRAALAGAPEAERILQFRIRATGEVRWSIVKAQPVRNADGSVRFAVNIWHDITDRMHHQRELEETSTQLEETAAELEATVSELEIRTEEAESRAARHKFLAEAGRMLAASLNSEETLRMIVHLAVPGLATWAGVSLLRENGRLDRLEVAHADPEKLRFAIELQNRFPPDPSTDPSYAVARSGQSQIYRSIGNDLLRALARSDEHYAVLRELDLNSAMIVPMKVRDQVIGVITFVRSGAYRPYNDEDLEFAESLAARSALALTNARLYREAQEANRTKADFLAVMSHELRTPLTAIFGYTELLSTGVTGEMSEAQRGHLDRIQASAAQLLTIIEDILAYARAEAGRDQLHTDAFRLNEVVSESIMIVKPNAEKKGLPIEADVVDVHLRTDRAKVRQILINLLSNAVKFTDEGSIRVCAAPASEDRCRLIVEDSGMGIDPADFDRIFEPFRQLEPSMTRKAGGTGLGLAVSQRFASLLGGSIEVESTPGKGSRFTVTLPLANTP